MPRRAPDETAEDRAIREVEAEDEDFLNRAALEAGPPADSRKLSERDEDDIWAIEDPHVQDVNQLAQRLMLEGLPPEEAQQLMLITSQTDQQRQAEWLQVLGQPTQSAEVADMLARAIRYPWRWSLLEDLDEPSEQVRKANTLDRRFQKRMTGAQQAEAEAAPPMPMMPTPMQPPAAMPAAAPMPPPMPPQMGV